MDSKKEQKKETPLEKDKNSLFKNSKVKAIRELFNNEEKKATKGLRKGTNNTPSEIWFG